MEVTELKGERAVVLVSGGLDSCVTLAEAVAAGLVPALLHVSYGQRTAARERRSFEAIAAHYGVPPGRRLVCELPHLGAIGGSSLTDASMPIPPASFSPHAIPSSYVPFRNAHFLAMAVSWAEVTGAGRIYIGAVEEDSSGYPDCRAEYYDVFNRLIEVGTKPVTRIEIVTPLIRMRKSEIVLRGRDLGAPFHLTWSCYGDEEVACGSCESCVLRLRGFEGAGLADPIPYRAARGADMNR